MASLRKKIYSISQGKFIEINTNQGLDGYTPVDVNPSLVDAETIRTIAAGEDVDTQRFGHVVADLLYNDEQVEAEAKKVSRLLTQGYFREIEEDFEIEVLDTLVVGPDTYLTKFAMFDGQVKIDDDSFLKTATEVFLVGDIASGSPTVNNIPSTLGLTAGMYVRGQGIPLNTTILSVDNGITITLDKNATETLTAIELQYRDDVVFEVGVNIDDITTTGVTYPRWRRDSIEIDKTGAINVVKGPESSVRLPVNTQLDSEYLIDTITNQSGNVYRLAIRTTNRVSENFTTDFVVGESIELRYTDAGYFDGIFEITATNPSEPYTVDVIVPNRQGNTWDQSTARGIVWLNRINLKSILVTKATVGGTTVIVDEIEDVANEVGLSGALQHIVKDELIRDSDGLWGVASRERVHLRNDLGQLLDWEHGQGLNVDPILAIGYNEDTPIQTLDETQLPFSGFEDIKNGTLTTFPVKIDFLPDNLFKASTTDLAGIKVGVKNEISRIGDEGIELELATADAIWDQSVIQQATNSSPSTTTLIDSGFDFTTVIEGYTIVPGQDYVLITGGAGEGQIAEITAAVGSNLTLSGITKPIDNTSTYTIFKALTQSQVINSNVNINNATLKSQVLSGENGRFGSGNQYSKVFIEFNSGTVTIQLNKWYFIRLKGRNEGVTWGSLPFVVIEKPEPLALGDNAKRNGFFEVFYDTIAGIYPSGQVLLEDEFGDLGVEYPDRTKAPHFRPINYQVAARALDLSGIFDLAIPPSDDVAYFDVHTGRVRFKDGAEPRRLYITYYKRDSLSGNSAEAVLKRRNPETFQDNTLQGHLNEIDNRFQKGATFKRVNKANGFKAYDEEDVKGPFEVTASKPNEIVYNAQDAFDNHDVDEDNYTARLSRGKASDIVAVKEGSLVLRQNQDYAAPVLNGTLKTTYTGTPVRPSVNYLDEIILPSEENLTTLNIFKRKLFDSTLTSPFRFLHDSTMLDTSLAASVDGTWNDLYFSEYKRDILMNALLSKSSYYSTLGYIFNTGILPKVREREIAKVLEETMDPVEGQGDATIIFEKFLSLNDISKDGRQYNGEHFIYPYTEVVKTREWKPIKSIDVVNESILAGNVQVFDSFHYSDKLVTVLADPGNSNRPRLLIYPTTKTSGADEYKTYDTFGAATVDLTFDFASSPEETLTPANEAIFAVKVLPFDDTKFFILYSYSDGFNRHVEGSLHQYSDGFRVSGSYQTFSQGGTVDAQYRIAAANVSDETIAVSWKSSSITTYVTTYTYDELNGVSAVTDEIILTSEDIVEDPIITKFSRSSFIVGFAYAGSLRVRKYSLTGAPEFFDTAQTVDFLEISTDTVTNGYAFNMIEVPATNDVLVVYSEIGSGGGLLSTKLVQLHEYLGTVGTPVTFIKDIAEANRPVSFSFTKVYNDQVCLTYINDADEIQQDVFNLDLSPAYNNRIETGVTDRTKVKSIQTSDNSNIVVFNDNLTTLRADLVEIRPDFATYVEEIGTELQLFGTGSYDKVSMAPMGTETAIAYIAPGAPPTIDVQVMNMLPKEGMVAVGSYGTEQVYDGSLADPVDLVLKRVTWVGANTTVDVLITVFIIGTTNHSIRMNVTQINSNGTFTDIGQVQVKAGAGSSQISDLSVVHAYDEKIVISYLDNTADEVYVNNISLHELDSLTPSITLGGAIGTGEKVYTSLTDYRKPRLIKNGRANEVTLIYGQWDGATDFDLEATTIDVDGMNWIGDGDASNLVVTGSEEVELPVNIGAIGASGFDGLDIVAIPEDNRLIVLHASSTAVKAVFLTIGAGPTNVSLDPVFPGWTISGQTLATPAACEEETVRILRNIGDDSFSIYYKDGTDIVTETWSFEDPTPSNLVKLQTTNYNLEATATAASDFDVINTDLLATDQISITKSVGGAGLISKSIKILALNEPLSQERLWQETDVDSNTTTKTYTQELLRIGGVDFQGAIIPPFDITRFPTYDLTDEFDVTLRNHSPAFSGINIVSIDKNRFTVVYNSSFNQTNNKILMQHFVLENGRIYEDSEVLTTATFDFSASAFDNMDLFATESADGSNVVITYRVPGTATGQPQIAVVDDTMTIQGVASTPYTLPEVTGALTNPVLRILSFEKQIGGYIATLIYDETNDVYWTHLLRDDQEIYIPPDYFSIALYDRGVNEVSDVKVDTFGHYYVTYIDGTDLKFHQFGMNGNKWGMVQVLGKSEFTVASSQSTAENSFQLPKLSQVNQIASKTKVNDGNVDFPTNSDILLRVLEIGSWDMDADPSKAVTHNMTDWTKIIKISVIIRNDLDNNRANLVTSIVGAASDSTFVGFTSSVVNLARETGGSFDTTDYDDTSVNRGWIIIEYVE